MQDSISLKKNDSQSSNRSHNNLQNISKFDQVPVNLKLKNISLIKTLTSKVIEQKIIDKNFDKRIENILIERNVDFQEGVHSESAIQKINDIVDLSDYALKIKVPKIKKKKFKSKSVSETQDLKKILDFVPPKKKKKLDSVFKRTENFKVPFAQIHEITNQKQSLIEKQERKHLRNRLKQQSDDNIK